MSDGLLRPFKLAVRNRGDWIEFIWCVNQPGAEDVPDALVVSRLRTSVVERDRQLFEDTVRMTSEWVKRATQSLTGCEVEKMELNRPKKPCN